MKRYLILAFVFMMCVGSAGCGMQDGEKQTESKTDSVKISEDNTVKSDAAEEPVRINVKESANKVSVTETELSGIAPSEDDEYVQINNNIANSLFLYPYKDGYIYAVQKSGVDGPDEVYFYRDSQGQISECKDLPDRSSIVYSFDDSIYYYDNNHEDAEVKRWQDGKETSIKNGYMNQYTLAEDYIYYTDYDEDYDITYICRVNYEGEEKQQLFALDVYVQSMCLYRDAIWFTFCDFEDEDDILQLGKLDLFSHEADVYDGIQIPDLDGLMGRIFMNNGFVYFTSIDNKKTNFKRLNIKDNTVETIFEDEVHGLNFMDDSILFVKGKKLYKVNNDGVKKIMTVKDVDVFFSDVNVLDGKIYIMASAGSMYDDIFQIDLEGNIVEKIYEGETSDELKKKIKNKDAE